MDKYDYNCLNSLAEIVGTPLYLVNTDSFCKNLQSISNAFQTLYNNVITCYSFKTNYLPYICKLALNEGCYAEVVSYLEYQIALSVGYSPQHIIFNGPIKRYSELEDAICRGSLVHIESYYEIDYLKQILRSHSIEANIGIRVNVAIKDENGVSAIYGEEEIGRFGFLEDEIPSVISSLNQLNCHIVSLQGHTSSKNRSKFNYIQILDTLLRIRRTNDLSVKFFDIGGGYFGPVPKGMFPYETPTFKEYANKIIPFFQKDPWVKQHSPFLVIEPGMSVAASSMSYITKIYDLKERGNRTIAQVDGNMFHIRPSMHKFHIPFEIVTKDQILLPESRLVDFTGSTCMESDILVRTNSNVDIKKGDFLKINNVGAYTFVMGSNFIQFLPHIAVLEQGKIKVIREGSNFKNFVEIFHW